MTPHSNAEARTWISTRARASVRLPDDEPTADMDADAESLDAWISSISIADTDAVSSDVHARALTLTRDLSRRARLYRGLLILATIVPSVLLLLRAGGVDVTGQPARESFAASHSINALGLTAAPWLSVAGRADAARSAFEIQPASTDANVIYVCWVSSRSEVSGLAPLHVAVSDDSARTWRAQPSPMSHATACRLVLDDTDPRRVVLDVQIGTAADCVVSRMFASADSGMHWVALVLPDALAGACLSTPPALSSVSGTLVLWAHRPQTASRPALSAPIWDSADGGATWRSLGAGLPPGSIEALVAARATGAILVLLRRSSAGAPAAAPAGNELWTCEAGCPYWYRLASVPGHAPSVYTSPDEWLPPGAGWGAIYAVDSSAPAGAADGQIPVSSTVYVSDGTPGGSWRSLSPGCGGEDTSSSSSEIAGRVLGVGPSGLLLMEVREDAVTLQPSSAELPATGVLCAWDPKGGRWLTPSLIEPSDSSPLAVGWDEQSGDKAPQLAIWFITRAGALWRASVPASDWWLHQSSSRCGHCM